VRADERSKWAENVGLGSVVRSTTGSIPPLIHIPAPVVSRVLYGGHTVAAAEAAERLLSRPAQRGSLDLGAAAGAASPPPSPAKPPSGGKEKLRRPSKLPAR
jgi:hypothetical protein